MLEEIYIKRNPPLNLLPEDEKLFEGDYECRFKIHPILHLEKSIILQDTVFSPSHMSFYTTHTHVNSLGILPVGKRIAHCILKKWRKIPHAIWIKDEWSANYFHWMTDCLPRLWIGLNTGISNQVILHDSYRHLPYVSESLKILNVKAIFYQSNENLLVDNLVLTPRTATFPNFNVDLTQLTRKKLSVQSEKKPNRKIYISRKYAPKRKTHNEVDVELLMIKHGFEIFYTEKLNLKEQISLMSETKTLVSLHGAALTNMIFLPEDSEVIELRNQEDSKTNCYFNLANALGLKYYYTLNQGDTPDSITSDFTIDLKALEKVISQLND
ncbi:glycosyltransferase family 61 protein [Algoriphagus sp.]|uniref:glycosyltransferase family 61 protein n=1 Tax=Algoriphagus sp. TaxID=1872435 RepID=UPI0025EA2CD8|nr:glycosyltransferase family 61 protein [Algoriphagus sp.]